MAEYWLPPQPPLHTFRQQDQSGATKDFPVEEICSMVKVKIEKLEDEEKEKMSFYPKADSNLMYYLCKHELAKLAAELGWKLILERMDQKLVAKLLVRKEIPIESCRDKVRELIVKVLPNLHQEKCCLATLSIKSPSNTDVGNKSLSDTDLGNKNSLQQALACLHPLIKAAQNQADVLHDKNLNCLIITGPTETVKQLHRDAKVKLYSVTMETVLESPSHGCLLRISGVLDQLKGQYPSLTVVLQDCNTKVRWSGTPEDVTQGKQEMEKFTREIKMDAFQVSMVMKKLLLTPVVKHYIDDVLKKESITCVWQITETGQVQVWSMKASSSKRAGHKIRESCREETFLLKDFPTILEVLRERFGLGTGEMNCFAVEETSDTVYVAAKSDTMHKIIQYLQDSEDQQTTGKQLQANQGGDNSERKTTSRCTIEVRGMDMKTSNDALELYFESKRAVGHPVDIVKFDTSKREKDSVIFITYENEEDVQVILQRQHTLDNITLTVKLFEEPEPVAGQLFYQEKVFFANMNPNTTQKMLEKFLKSKVNVSPIECLYREGEDAVLVTFDGVADFGKLKDACQNSALEANLLEVKKVPVSHSVVVSDVGKSTSLDTLEYYFENTRRSGGGDVTEVRDMSEGYFLVTFEDPEVLDRVCQREHKLDGQTITVQIYYEMLGHRVSHTGPVFKVPRPLVIKEADQNKIQHFTSTDKTKLEKQLSDHHAKLHWPEDPSGHLELECLLTEEVDDSNRLVISWEEMVRDILSDFLAQTKKTTKAQVVMTSPRSRNQRSPKKDGSKEHLIPSQHDFEHISDIIFPMSEEEFLAIQFFCRGEKDLDQQAVSYRDGMLQITCNDSSDKKVVLACIESKLKHIEEMNKDDVSFTSAEEPKIKGIIKQIHDTIDGVFCYQLRKDEDRMVHLMALSYGQLQTAKHKISLGLGRIKQTETRRNRQSGKTPLQQGDSTPSDKSRFSQSYSGNQSSWKPPTTAGYGSVSPKDFTTSEGLLVRVYPGSILHLDVDCIVNAANGDLQHGGGVAYVISNAAGYEIDKESRDYIIRYGPLGVGQVCATTAGNLKYKGVIHAVGPRWYDYNQDQKQQCLDDLKTAVKNSLEEADLQGYHSIAIPAISSGIFGVPKEHCAQQYYRAVEEYSRSRGRDSTLTEVHFIDKDTQMCQLIQTTFAKCFTGNVGAGSHGADTGGRRNSSSSVRITRNTTPDFQRSRSVDPTGLPFTDQQRNFQHSASSGKRFEYQIGNNLTVHIIHGNIVEIEADAIVSPENVQCDSSGSIAREIARVAGRGYVDNDQSELRLGLRKLKMTEVLETLAGRSQFKYVLHVVAPEWEIAAFKDQPSYWENLKKSYKNILSLPDKKHLNIGSLAFPVLGTGKLKDHPTPVISIAKTILKVCKRYAEKTSSKKTLYFCDTDMAVIHTLNAQFEKEFNKGNKSQDAKKGQTGPDRTGRDQGATSEVPEDCCICIDAVTNPKKLSCGHVFCTDCIDQQFKYKPACPQCGAVHGKITGDQPPGTMTMITKSNRSGSLPGYEGCGIINITYNFPPGKQGPDHPTPGRPYQGISRPGYLPDNEKGRLVAKLLRIAFDRKLVFTIGRSRTTGQYGVVTWNGIHHMTRMTGGPQAFGYPDPTYLDRVLDELKAKGVTEESLNDP